jgi:phospholipid/cholesterol/gamma-HCH transport system substrate-binding protein
MRRDNVNYLWVGSFVLVMAAVLLYALYRLTGQSGQGDVYYTRFPNVAGIKTGTVVTYEGFEVGNVMQVEPVASDGRTVFRVTLNLRKPLKIPSDSRAVIATPGLLSAPLVDIREGRSGEMLAGGGEIAGSAVPNLMDSVASLASELGKVTETSIKPMLAQISQNVTPAMADLRTVLERINRTSARVERLFSEENVQHWSRLLKNGDGASVNALKLTQEMMQVRGEVEALVRDSRGLVAGGGKDVRDLLKRADAALYQLESAGRNLNEFSRTIRDNPAALIVSKPPVDTAGAPQ